MSTLKTTAPLPLLDSRDGAPTEASRASSCPEPGEAELETGTLTDSASMWSRKLIGQSVALKERKRDADDEMPMMFTATASTARSRNSGGDI